MPEAVIDWAEFDSLVRAAFFTVRRAIATQQPSLARHVMTEEAWQAIRAQVDVLRLDGCDNRQQNLDVAEVRPGDHELEGDVVRVTVRLMITGIECVVERASGRVVSGDPGSRVWLEEWAFARSRDAQLLEAARAPKCPNCGGPLSLSAEGLCSFCQAVVPGAKTDWLVASIGHVSPVEVDPAMAARAAIEAGSVVVAARAAQQADAAGTLPAFRMTTGGAAVDAGMASITAHDPGFTPADLVVEAREVFLAVENARNQLQPSSIRPLVSDALYTAAVAHSAEVTAAGRNEIRAYLDITEVHFVEAASDGGRDRLVARVSATAAPGVIDLRTGDLVEGSANPRPFSEDLVFERSAAAATNALSGLLAHRCPACGEPIGVAEDGRCVYCARHITGGEFDWILAEVRQPAGDAGPGPAGV